MPFSPAVLSRRRLGTACLLVAAALTPLITSVPDAHAVAGDCVGQAQTPGYNSYAKWASAGGYLPCGGTFTLKLMTSTGTTLASASGVNTTTRLQMYTKWTACPTGTVVYSYLVSKSGSGQYPIWSGTSTSASIVCTA